MTLEDVLKAYGKNKMVIRQGLQFGTSGSSPVMTYSGWNDYQIEIPEKLLKREVRTINAFAQIEGERHRAYIEVILNGWEEI